MTELGPEERRHFEWCLGESFRSVRIVDRPHLASGPRGAALGTCRDEEVFVQPGLRGTLRTVALGHELAHVVQKRNGFRTKGEPASADMLEAEAHRAASSCARGERFTCRQVDHGPVVRAWGEAGHYYTALYVMLAAGVPWNLAVKLAELTQMPDQVDELDATVAGKDWLAVESTRSNPSLPIMILPLPPEFKRRAANDLIIQKGLHCLTGGNAEAETAKRRAVLESANLNSIDFGIAIHPFGDSYAHRQKHFDTSQLYSPKLGHLIDGHSPDYIATRPSLYKRYGCDLYDVLVKKLGGSSKTVLTKADLEKELTSFAGIGNDNAAILAIRGSMMQKLKTAPPVYMPENEQTKPWSKYDALHHLGPHVFKEALRLAHLWSYPSPTAA